MLSVMADNMSHPKVLSDMPLYLGLAPYNFFLLLSIVVYFLGSLSLSLNYQKKYKSGDIYALPNLKQSVVCLLLLIVVGFYGARLGHLILSPRAYSDSPLSFFSLYPVGLVSWGSFLGFILVPFLARYFFKCSPLRVLDMLFLFVPLQIATRRMGCLLAGCCRGSETLNSLICRIQDVNVGVHPFPLYIIILCLILFIFLLFWAKRPHQPGTVFSWFFILYCSMRFVAEFFRGEAVHAFGLNKAQIVCVILLPIFMPLHLALRRSAIKRKLI